jgi:hypothetical protein
LVAAALPGVLPFDRLIATSAESDTLALLPLWWLQEHIITLSEVTLVVVVAAVLLAGASVLVRSRWAYVLPALVAAWLVFVNERAEDFDHGFPRASAGGLATGLAVKPHDWIDRRVGRNADVAFVWPGSPLNDNALWENEFFNRSIQTVYDLVSPSAGDLPETRLSEQPDGTLAAHGHAVRVRYVLTAQGTRIAGNVIARDDYAGTELLRTNGTLSIAYKTAGLYPKDTWSGKRVRYTQYHCTGGTVAVSLLGDGSLLRQLQTVTGRSGNNVASVKFPPARPAPTVLKLRLQPAGDGMCHAVFTVAHTAVPAAVEPASFDRRSLGARFVAFHFTRP